MEGSVVGNVGGQHGTHGETLEQSDPVEGSLGLRTVALVPFLAPWLMVAAEL